ncbi:hypothetical protein OHB41_05020 [Streptomyces sp. NBC_01571]|uniref:hypothetical protein n=1 Tax=Streptomyces sp. NBC_01571 TaxID=2975883 RepID=UPI00225533C1|nr:hypothetical protein [Streptomyces sp. NBC_01571]MCX4572559.1 hypothetical protein [Streptomyces sp. NBC_01571]
MSLEQDRTPARVDATDDEVREPSEEERAAWARVCRTATGMRHHEAKAALEDVREAARGGALTGQEALVVRAEVEEWERITEALADHAGTYDPDHDPFVQGELAARAHRTGTATRPRGTGSTNRPGTPAERTG